MHEKNNKKKESSYLKHFDANNLYGWTMPQKLPANNFKWKKMHLNSMKRS